MCYSVISKMFDLFDEEEGVCHRSFLIIDDKHVVLRRALFQKKSLELVLLVCSSFLPSVRP